MNTAECASKFDFPFPVLKVVVIKYKKNIITQTFTVNMIFLVNSVYVSQTGETPYLLNTELYV